MTVQETRPIPVASGRARKALNRLPGEKALVASPSTWLVWGGVVIFFVLLVGVIVSVLVDSFGKQWFNTWLPAGWTAGWYGESWERFGLAQVMGVTLGVALITVVVSLVIGIPASYVLARKDFPGKQIVNLLFLLPILIPPIAYGIPLATVMYNLGLGRTITAVILVNLVPAVPFVIMTMTPFIEQINPSIENAARMSGADTLRLFTRILAPLLVPGILAAAVLVLVRTVGLFELTFLVSGPGSDTLVVAIYRAMTASGGGEARQLVSSMGVLYTVTMMVILVIALRFVNPTQLVARVKDSDD